MQLWLKRRRSEPNGINKYCSAILIQLTTGGLQQGRKEGNLHMNDPEDLAARLRRLRNESDLTQVTLADRVGVSAPTIWSWEKGKTRPKGPRIAALAEALEVAESELILPASNKTLDQEIARSKARVAALAGCNADQVKITIKW